MPVFPGPVCRHLHFPKLNNICHFSDHLTKNERKHSSRSDRVHLTFQRSISGRDTLGSQERNTRQSLTIIIYFTVEKEPQHAYNNGVSRVGPLASDVTRLCAPLERLRGLCPPSDNSYFRTSERLCLRRSGTRYK